MTVAATDHRIATARGTLFAREWRPAAPPSPADPALLLLHDSLGCVELWREFPARLATATGRRVAAYDRLGFGRSDPHPGPLPVDFIREEGAEALPAVREALGLDAVVLFGHSVGGAMAVAAAARRPEGCAAVVTEAAQAFVEERTLEGIRAARAGFQGPDRMQRLARYHGDKARWVLDAWTEIWLSPAFAGWRLDDDLRRVRCPLLAIHGDRDEYGSAAHPERIAGLAVGRSRVVLLEDCGHVPHRERPARVLHEVARFLASDAPGGVRR